MTLLFADVVPVLLKQLNSSFTDRNQFFIEDIESYNKKNKTTRLPYKKWSKMGDDKNYAVIKMKPIMVDYDVPGIHVLITKISNV